jgi:hypothetical protein
MRVLGWLVRLWLALVWAGMALVAMLVLLVSWPFVRPPRRHAPVDITGKPFPDIRDYQRDLGDEQDPLESSKDIVTEGLGHWEHSAILVLDGMLLTLGELHPYDQDVFGPARRPQ